LAIALKSLPTTVRFLLHGDEARIRPELARNPELARRSEIRHTDKVIASDEKPATAVRRGKGASMWNAIEAVKSGESVAAVSCGIYGGRPLLDLDYIEDSRAEVDMNLVMTSSGDMVEVQATGEGGLLKRAELDALIDLGRDIFALGGNGRHPFWHVGIEDGMKPGQCWGGLAVSDRAVCASGDYARHFIHDGVRYGHRSASANDLMEHYLKSRSEGFGPEVKRRILLGTYVLSSGYYDAYYLQAQKARTLIRDDFTKAFEKVDVIVSPTSPTPAHKLGELIGDPLQAYLEDVFTIPANLAGLPAISVPCGTIAHEGANLPVGLQFITKALDEATLFQAAHAFEVG
jgi:hypothetical protein